MERGRGYFGGPAHTTAMPPKRPKKKKPPGDPYFEGIIAAGKEHRATPKLKWPKLDYDHSYGHARNLRTLIGTWKTLKLCITYVKWLQWKEKTKKGTRERKIAHYMELYYHRKFDIGFGERNPLSAKHKRGIRWAKAQLQESA